jgi:hypothetical protein
VSLDLSGLNGFQDFESGINAADLTHQIGGMF